MVAQPLLMKLWQLVRPCATRWNSVFDAVARLNRNRREKGNSALSNICHDLDGWICMVRKSQKKELGRYIYNFSGSSILP